ncbi:MAG: M28 family peptidase [Kiritimatiellae bacterium]|nr:M28 family peptidase [Kiritimatiellia bacterium]
MKASGERIEGYLRQLVEEIGPRNMGSREDQAAIDCIAGLLREWGHDPRLHEVACPCWQHRETRLTLLARAEEIPAQACQFSAACDIAGDIVPVDTPEAANNAPVAGKVCLMPAGMPGAGGVTLQNLVALALEARGALGLIVDRRHARRDAFDGKIVREPDLRRMPVACVSAESAAGIRASGSPVRLYIDASFWHGHTFNIEAVIAGAGPGRLFLTAHHDTGAASPGACDNGTGVAILLEVARVLAGERPPCEVRLLFTGAHERAGQGSHDFVRENKPLLADALLTMNFDGVGAAGGVLTAAATVPEPMRLALADVMRHVADWEVPAIAKQGSDGGPFAAQGVPTAWFRTPRRTPDPAGSLAHTQFDDLARVDTELVRTTAETALEIIRSGWWRKIADEQAESRRANACVDAG